MALGGVRSEYDKNTFYSNVKELSIYNIKREQKSRRDDLVVKNTLFSRTHKSSQSPQL